MTTFTKGLDRDSIRRVRQGSSETKRENSFFMSNQRLQSDPIVGLRNHVRGFGLPSPAKFRSGHLPSGVVPVSRTIPVGANDSGSDMDISSDSDEEAYGVRYLVESSPQDDKFPNGAGPRYTSFMNRQVDIKTGPVQSDFSSSRNATQHRQGYGLERFGHGGGGNAVPPNCLTDDESSDSVTSSEVASTVTRNGHLPQGGKRTSRVHYSNGQLSPNVKTTRQNFCGEGMQNNLSDNDFPSAPPFAGSVEEIHQVAEQFRADSTPCPETSSVYANTDEPNTTKNSPLGAANECTATRISDPSLRNGAVSSSSLTARFPTFHASGLGPWYALISYDACVRLCLHSWAEGCMEAPAFLENECALLRKAFSLQQVLLQPEDELLRTRSSELVSEGAATKPKKTLGKMKVQVRKVKMGLDPPTGCSFSSLKPPRVKLESLRFRLSHIKSTLSSEWEALRKVRVAPRIPSNGSFSQQSLAYVHAGTRYVKEMSELLKIGLTTMHNGSSSYEIVQETYSCLLRLKSSSEDDAVRMQPGSGETHIFLPDSLGDNLIIELQDSKGKYFGRVIAQVADIADDPGDKLRWWSIYHEPEHEVVGRMQLYINYSTSPDDNSHLKGDKLRWWSIYHEPEHEVVGRMQLYINYSTSPDDNSHLKYGSVAETVAYDLVLEAAMKVQRFQQRNLVLNGSWRWLVTEFASYYGISDAYAKLRYLSYVMDVATPTADCLDFVHDLLLPVLLKGDTKRTLSHQENRILGEVCEQIEQTIALVFENYKSLDESSPSGVVDVFRPGTGVAAPALAPALKLYNLLHDILSSEAQLKLCRYFQTAAKKRSRRHLAETDEFVSNNNENTLKDSETLSMAYQKMKSLCSKIRNEIFTDIEIHSQHVLPSFIDLPNLSASIYSVELCNRLRAFLVACPPSAPSPPVAELVIATADFQRDLACWNINSIKSGVDAKELFHLYITHWIEDERLSLLQLCKPDKEKWSSVKTQHSTTPFVDEMYDRLKETLNEYEVIICRWPEYSFVLENAIADVEKAVLETLDKQYADVLSPLKENATPIKFGLKYVQKISKGSVNSYTVPDELGILLNSMKRMLDMLRPNIEGQLKSWGACIPDGGNTVPGERIGEVTVVLRAKFRNYLQAIVEKLAENTKLQSDTKLKKIIQDTKESLVESDIQSRMQPMKDLLTKTIDYLHPVFETHVFIIICRGLWDRMGQDVLRFLVNRKENQSCYRGSRVAVSVLDNTFASQMQRLLGNVLQEKDLEPPRSMLEVRSMLCKDSVNYKDNNYYF
ncbi:unnamed protein product [Ilex paraguariensis]|uniref:Pesticidal crystal cry8Ba protein n=1 Tax=Ilex paraguariensis TaxID=185542 RepID=A0ABC8TI93_9AQUA